MVLEILKIIAPIVIAFIGIIVPAANLYFENKKLKKENKNLKQEVEDISQPIEMDLKFFNSIKDIVENIFQITKADRFLILTATNGTKEMKFATAVYEQHNKNEKISLSIGATSKYVRFEFDSEYKRMLKEAENVGPINLNVEKMQPCDLKIIYEAEQIKHSKVFFLVRMKIDDINDRVFYCSVATKSEHEYTKVERLLIRTQIDKMKQMFRAEYQDLLK